MVNIILGIVLLVISFVMGYFMPKWSWKLGLLITSPLYIFIGCSVLFAGNFPAFVKYDLPVILIALVLACSGSFIGAWFRTKSLKV